MPKGAMGVQDYLQCYHSQKKIGNSIIKLAYPKASLQTALTNTESRKNNRRDMVDKQPGN